MSLPDNWTPLSAPASDFQRYDPDRLMRAAQNAEEAGDIAAAEELRKAAQIEIDAELLRRTDGQGTEFAPLSEMSGPERFAQGGGLAFRNLGRGAAELVGVDLADKTPEQSRRDEFLMRSPAGVAGNVAGNVAAMAPTAFIPGANTVMGATVTGAAIGALQPTGEEGLSPDRLMNTGLGAAGGFLGGVASKGISRVLTRTPRPEVAQLLDENVRVTPGQAAGGMASRIEQKSTSIPIIGDDILNARMKSRTDFNVATINKVLRPIKATVDEPGNAGVLKAGQIVSEGYDKVLDSIKYVQTDDVFTGEVGKIYRMVDESFAKPQRDRFFQIVKNTLHKDVTPAGRMSGESYKKIISSLRQKGTEFAKSASVDERELGHGLREVAASMAELLKRARPQQAPQLKALDEAYRGLKTIRQAASYVGAPDGVFTPAQLLSAVRATDKTMGKRAFSEGTAFMQPWAQAGKKVIGDNIGNSFTFDRGINAAAILGLGAGALNPGTAAPVLGGMAAGKALTSTLYSDPAKRAIGGLLAGNPGLGQQLGQGIGRRMVAPLGGLGGYLAQ